MFKLEAKQGKVLRIAVQGERDVIDVSFDISEWVKALGQGTARIGIQRPGERTWYEKPLTIDGTKAHWIVANADTAIEGTGRVMLRYYVGEALKEQVWLTSIEKGFDEPMEGEPNPWADIAEEVAANAADARNAAGSAELDAKNAAYAAEKAQQAAESIDEDKIEQTIADYLDKHPVAAPVQSVNGKTGEVELTAEEVGAVPSSKSEEIAANTAARHTHDNKGVLDGITEEKVSEWDTAKETANAAASAAGAAASAASEAASAANSAAGSASDAASAASSAAASAAEVQRRAEAGDFDGAPGKKGDPGESPSVSVQEIQGGHRVTIKDVNGQKTFDVMDGMDGQPGQDGTSPTVTVTNITGGHRVTITDKNGEHTFDVMNGQSGGGGGGVDADAVNALIDAAPIVSVSDTEPTSPRNRIWVRQGETYEIPTVDDVEQMIAASLGDLDAAVLHLEEVTGIG